MNDNIIIPFQLESSNLRGRFVRLGGTLTDILIPHHYPEILMGLTGEVTTLAIILASILKYDGIFTLQIQGDGPLSLLMADVTTAGDVRACATYNPERFEAATDTSLQGLVGNGYMAFTVDQGEDTERYQGLVELKGETLAECAQHYFMQSEQIQTGLILKVGRHNNEWRGAAIMLQKMPQVTAEYNKNDHRPSEVVEDDWRRAMILLQSCKDEELLSPVLHPHEILLRLFHEEGVRIYDQGQVRKGCRCNPEKLKGVLSLMPEEDRHFMAVEGTIIMNCQFCNRDFSFSPDEISSS